MLHALVLSIVLPATHLQEEPAVQARILFTLTSPTPGARFGAAVADAGDLDRDGLADIVVGSPRSDVYGMDAGNVRIYSGADGRLLREIQGQPGTQYGYSLANAGDVDLDGVPDLLVGAPFKDGTVSVFSGSDGHLIHLLRGDIGSRFGQALAGAGDIDADGVPDFLIGEPQNDVAGHNAGRVRVYSGLDGGILYERTGAAPFDLFGTQVAGTGDVTGDGHADFLVGVPFADDGAFNAGCAIFFSGATGAPHLAVHGLQPGDQLGFWLRGGPDVDGDGVRDFACGLPGADVPDGGFDAGAAQIRSGADGSVLVHAFGPEAGGFAGTVASPADWSGDGTPDLVLGAPSAAGDLGQVRLVSGADNGELVRLNGGAPNGWFGAALATLSDVDGDGAPDLAIGSPGHEDFPDLVGSVQVVSFGPRRRQRARETPTER